MKPMMVYDFYIAAPLFSQAEREYNLKIAQRLRGLDCSVFLPQEKHNTEPNEIFRCNRDNLKISKNILVICDGSDMDSGSAWECGYFYRHLTQSFILALRTDFRGGDSAVGFNIMISESADRIFNTEIELFDFLKQKYERD